MMHSPDPFTDHPDSDDSFEKFVPTPNVNRRRSDAIIVSDEGSFDGITGYSQVTVIENCPNTTVLEDENKRANPDDTITRMLESSDEEDETENNSDNDALADLLKSFRTEDQKRKEVDIEQAANISIDIFGDLIEEVDSEHEAAEYPDREGGNSMDKQGTMLPVEVPIQNNIKLIPRKRRLEPKSYDCEPSTSAAHGPVGVVSSDSGEYWNQQKTITIHGQNFEINNFNDYMRMKITKLNHQVNHGYAKPLENVSRIMEGFSVFVNGYTDPPALVIRDLMISHGGEYHCYYQHGITSYTIASSIATAKINRIRENEIFIKADWITESIAAGKPLDYRDFLIYEKGSVEKGQMQQFLTISTRNTGGNNETTSSNQFSDARNPNFIRDYYARSRLHLISTLAQDMKDFVANLKLEGKLTEKCFEEKELIDMKSLSNEISRESTVFHVDLDCFFVSVAVRNRIDLKHKEVAITHSKGTISNSMSEVASCSYAARDCGVKNGMLVRDALQKCPQLTLLPYQFEDYVQVSRKIYEILASYTLEVRAVSCDEMYINMSSFCEKYEINDPTILAEHIRKVIREKTQCPASVGIGSTSLLARLATRHAKPDGVFWVNAHKKNEFISEEKVKDLPGFGYEMMNRLTSFFGDITKCRELQLKTERELVPVFGPKLASKILRQCRGIEEDPDDFWATHVRKSVSCDINYGIRFTKRGEVIQLMTAIGAELERKLIDSKLTAGSITLKLMVRSANAPIQTSKFMGHGICDTFTKTCNLNVPTTRGESLTSEAMKLYAKVSPKVEDLRGVGVTCGKLKSKLKKDAATAVQEMFGKTSRVGNMARTDEQLNIIPRNEDELDKEPVIIPAVTEDLEVQSIPRQINFRVANDIDIPEIVKSTLLNGRSDNNLELEDLEDDGLVENRLAELECIIQNEPTKESVTNLQEMLSTLLNYGKLSAFETVFRKFEEISMDSSRCDTAWFSVFHLMVPFIEEESKDLLEFPIATTRNLGAMIASNTDNTSISSPEPFVPKEVFVIDSTKHT